MIYFVRRMNFDISVRLVINSLTVQYFGAIGSAISVVELSDMGPIVMHVLRFVWRWFWPKWASIDVVRSIAVIRTVDKRKECEIRPKADTKYIFNFTNIYLFELKLMLSTNVFTSFKLFKLVVGWLSAYWTICTVCPVHCGGLWTLNNQCQFYGFTKLKYPTLFECYFNLVLKTQKRKKWNNSKLWN